MDTIFNWQIDLFKNPYVPKYKSEITSAMHQGHLAEIPYRLEVSLCVFKAALLERPIFSDKIPVDDVWRR